jgi:hypothetical protein
MIIEPDADACVDAEGTPDTPPVVGNGTSGSARATRLERGNQNRAPSRWD